MEKLSTVDKIELIARYEIRHNTPEPDRITEWFGDYAMYTSKKLAKEEMNNIFATKFVKLLLDEWFNGFRGEKSIENRVAQTLAYMMVEADTKDCLYFVPSKELRKNKCCIGESGEESTSL